MRKDLLIIIPAYNEEKNIVPVLEKLSEPNVKEIADVLVMNDASSDATGKIVKKHGFEVVTHVFNLGYGSALQLGYKYAVQRGYKYVIQMDADGQHDTCNISKIYEELKGKDENGCSPDIVLGSRFIDGSNDYKVSIAKKFAIKLFKTMIYLFSGKKISDPTTGLQGLSQRAALFYSQYNNFDDKYPDANMLLQMILLGYNIKEIPAIMHFRKEGNGMHSGLKPVIYMFRMTFSIFAVVIREKILKLDKKVRE